MAFLKAASVRAAGYQGTQRNMLNPFWAFYILLKAEVTVVSDFHAPWTVSSLVLLHPCRIMKRMLSGLSSSSILPPREEPRISTEVTAYHLSITREGISPTHPILTPCCLSTQPLENESLVRSCPFPLKDIKASLNNKDIF